MIDHITITAPTLQLGAEFVHQALGVWPQAGGEHPRMGTHNLLLRLGDSQFLEVISVNPQAAAPPRPRWFMLDSLSSDSGPSLAAWVAQTPDIHKTVACCSEESLGEIEPMSRGNLNWLITISADGTLPLDGAAPVLIEWPPGVHPSANLQDHGLSLAKLEIFHPEPERVSQLLHSMGFDSMDFDSMDFDSMDFDSMGCQGPLSISRQQEGKPPRLLAHINTPWGLRVI